MAAQIKPGQWIKVTVKSQPRTAAGKKTMVRLFGRDIEVQRERRRQAKSRPIQPSRRGGRIWMNRPPKLEVAKTTAGSTYRLFASVAVLRDLKSIERYVEIAPAK